MADNGKISDTPITGELAGQAVSKAAELLQNTGSTAFECLLRFSDDSLKGESKDKAHTDWIKVYGLCMAGAFNGTERAGLEGIQFTKAIDNSSPNLIACRATGKTSDVTIHICRSLEGKQTVYYEIKLTKAFVSSSRILCFDDQASIPMELISLGYEAINFTRKVDNAQFK